MIVLIALLCAAVAIGFAVASTRAPRPVERKRIAIRTDDQTRARRARQHQRGGDL